MCSFGTESKEDVDELLRDVEVRCCEAEEMGL